MSRRPILRPGGRRVASVVVLALLAGAPVTIAAMHPGFPETDPDLRVREVWVTNGDALLAGRLNRQIAELDAAVATTDGAADVLQDGEHVFLVDTAAGTIERVDPAFTNLTQGIDVPPGSQVAHGGGVLAVLSPEGDLWTLPAEGELAFDADDAPVAELGEGAQLAVGVDGRVAAASVRDERLVTIDPDGTVAEHPLEGLGEHAITLVGDRPVVLDDDADVLIVDGRRIDLPGDAARLQQRGPAADRVFVATSDALLEVELDGSGTTRHEAQADAAPSGAAGGTAVDAVAEPVRVGACAYGAWGGLARVLTACDGADDLVHELPSGEPSSRLAFRVNRDVVALNDLDTGNAWLADADLRLVDDWSEVIPPDESDDDGEDRSSRQGFQDALAERTEENRAPVARDDDLGVRPGSTAVLEVLENDTDADGDVLTISDVGAFPEAQGRLEVIDGGRALQVTAATAATGTASLRYAIEDGRGGVAEAALDVRIVPDGANAPPQASRRGAVSVERDQRVAYHVLADWTDPDGDAIVLAAASAPGETVRFSPDGLLTFEHRSGTLGEKVVTYMVSDGTDTAEGELVVDVRPTGTLDPVGIPDYVEVVAGAPTVVRPLENDLSPSGAPLGLIGVPDAPDDAQVGIDANRGTITVEAMEPGDHTFLYELGADGRVGSGLVRVRVLAPAEAEPSPIAVQDVAYLRPGEPAEVAVLANDVSPLGRVLAVRSVDAAAVDGLVSVELLGNAVARVTATEPLDRQLRFDYTVSDGQRQAAASVVVVPVPPIVTHQPPVAAGDHARVRAGDVVSVPVLENDHHPDAATMRIAPELTGAAADARADPAAGYAFVSADRIRFQAPAEPGTHRIGYTVVDDFEQRARAELVVEVVAPDAGEQAPVAEPVIARTFAGSSITIEVPLDGVDPDGDSVRLAGVVGAPSLGRVVEQTSTSLVYEAFDTAAGTDEIGLALEDARGVRGTGVLRIGVVPRPATAMPPVAVDDVIELRPGRVAAVDVLANDSDPGGAPLEVTGLDDVPEAPGLDVRVRDGRQVVVAVPDDEGRFVVGYDIANGRGGTDRAALHVIVDEDAPILPPTAEDLVLEPDDVRGEDEVVVRPLDRATNAGGLVEDLAVELVGPNGGAAEVLPDGSVSIAAREERYAVAYRLVNRLDDLAASAFIIVPARDDTGEPPYLADVGPFAIPVNGRIEWPVDDLVVSPSGREVRILGAMATVEGERSFVDADTLRFIPPRDFRGEAAVTFEVTDVAGVESGEAGAVFLTLPVLVGDPEYRDVAPEFTPTIAAVEPGEEAVAVDLRAATSHPNPDVLAAVSFVEPAGAAGGIEARLDGSALRLSAPLGTAPGTGARIRFTLVSGEFRVPGFVDVKVVSSTRPKAQAVDDGPLEMLRGTSETVAVLANDVNPFAGDAPLRVVGAEVESADAGSGASVAHTPTGVTVRTGAAFSGTLSIVYRVEDATRDPARQVRGRVTVVVRDRPDAPTITSVVDGDGAATLTWRGNASNNSPITGYTVQYGTSSLAYPASAAGTPQTISGLANGTAYTFRVTATNAIGVSEPSAASRTVVPYGAPGTPASATLTGSGDGSGRITLSWTAPLDDGGRAVGSYEWRMSAGSTGSGTTSNRSLTRTAPIDVPQQFQVRACNARACGGWATSNVATATAPWAATNPTTVTTTTCPEPDSTYTNPPTNAERGCTMNPAGMLPVGSVIDAICRSQRWGLDWFYLRHEAGVYDGWFVLASDTNRAGRSVADC
ncbi:Ig-like domain-containing protein [Agromyces sp. NPDC056523]|uniref:Ig-like domain-containing protein n=1 Tax=Agromyces sp. NPDC056523 TaxID=3345850 RepID=UPI00367192FE